MAQMKKHCEDFAQAYLTKRYTLEELLNESMTDDLLDYIAEHMPNTLRHELGLQEGMFIVFRLGLGFHVDNDNTYTLTVNERTQELALRLISRLYTKALVVQCCSTYNPGHRCEFLWEYLFNQAAQCPIFTDKNTVTLVAVETRRKRMHPQVASNFAKVTFLFISVSFF